MHIRIPLCVSALAVALLTGCGYIGPVQPPLLDIPLAVPYVNVAEFGNKIVVEFTLPELTTEGNPLRNVRMLEVRVGPSVTPFSADVWAQTAKSYPIASPAPGPYSKEIPVADWMGKEVLISARAVGPKGKAAQWSTVKILTVEPPLATPVSLTVANVENGVKLTWQGAAPKYRIYRTIPAGSPERLGDSDKAEFVDETSKYDIHYEYRVQGIRDDQHQSDVTSSVGITPQDKFPPAVPGALTAILGVSTIELAWTRNVEPDFRGYTIYRSTDGGPMEKIAEGLPAPTFSDSKIEAGKKYRYEVSAVDLKGNESAHSTPAEASAQ